MKYRILLSALILVLAGTGCTPGRDAPSAPSSIDEEPSEPAGGEGTPDFDGGSSAPDAGGPVADAAMYRGVIHSVEVGNSTLLVLRQAVGTDFGHAQLNIALTEDTRMDFAPENLRPGAYLQVYYGGDGDTVAAITATLLPDAELCIYNGAIAELVPGAGGAGEGSLLLNGLDGGDFLFHYGPQTQFYLDFGALAPGDELNIFFSGASIDSIPPQATALEVRPYRA